MELAKTLLLVGVSAGVGGWLGDKAYGFAAPKLPTQAQTPAASAGIKLGAQAAGAVAVFAVLKSVF